MLLLSPKSAYLTEIGPLVGMLEPDVLVQGCPFDAGVFAALTLELHVLLARVLSKDVRLKLIV